MPEYEIINRIAMALAMCDGTPPEHFRALDEPTIYGYRRRAWAAVAACKAALTDAGYAIVSLEPTQEMLQQGDDSAEIWREMVKMARKPLPPVSSPNRRERCE